MSTANIKEPKMDTLTTTLSKHGKHKIADYTCPVCATLFHRQIRRVKTPRPLCPQCARTKKPRLASYTTKKLKEIIANNGVSDYGTDFEERLEDIKEELYKREELLRDAQMKQRQTRNN